ncbi:hypothetical protein B484DRAFT_454808, partial [Ochromonadaceae sp. CCMP2298]
MEKPADDFLISFKYQNHLPNAPSGPFLKSIDVMATFNALPAYRTSTLETGYVWQPHFGADLGLNVDLVDQEAVLALDTQALDQADLKYLTGPVDKSRGKTREIDQSQKPWWLRNTTYMQNNQSQHTRQSTSNAEIIKQRVGAKISNQDILSAEYINESFESVEQAVLDLIKQNPKKRVLQVLPVIPLDPPSGPHAAFLSKIHSLVRFDEDPELKIRAEAAGVTVAALKQSIGAKHSQTLVPGRAQAAQAVNKRLKLDVGIVTNVRQSAKTESTKARLVQVSLVSPQVRGEQKEGEEEANGADSEGDANGAGADAAATVPDGEAAVAAGEA